MDIKANLKIVVMASMFSWVMMSVTAVGATTLYVDDDASPGGDGLGWSTALKYLQDGLAAASYGDEIHVAQGLYIPDQNSANPGGTGDREVTFELISGVVLKGGYAGIGQTDPDLWDVDLYETILSGDLNDNDVKVFSLADLLTEPTRSENCYGVVRSDNTDASTVLDGFTVTAGNANEDYPNERHGGMYNTNGSRTVINCTFSNNSAIQGGGGMYNKDCTTVVIDCAFLNNFCSAGSGGLKGLYADLTLTNCIFFGNGGSYGGAMGSGGTTDNNVTVSNCIFAGNSASSTGGGISNGSNTMVVTNSTFIGNSASNGGGMGGENNGETLINCTFVNNSASYDGGAIWYGHIWYGEPTLINCILWGNSADEGPQIALSNSTLFVNYCNIQGGLLDIHDVYGISTVVWGDGNIGDDLVNDDPLFADADGADNVVGTEDDNLRLLTGSPCIDAGDNTAVPSGINDDYNGFPRFIDDLCTTDTGNGTAPVVDMGAYEFLGSDIDSDGDVNLKDFSQFALYWLDVACEGCSGADLTCDGNVDIDDMEELASNWLWGQ